MRRAAAGMLVLLWGAVGAACGSGGGDADGASDVVDGEETGADADADGADLGDVVDAADEAGDEGAAEDVADVPEETGDDGGDAETVEGPPFAFALMTDLHIGESYEDYGESGWDDSGGDEYGITDTLRLAVAKVNFAIDEHDIRFVMVTGDLSDSGERSELTRARDILDELHVPYFPLLGNHDIWPYTSGTEAPTPLGDEFLQEVFADHFAALATLFPSLERAPVPVWNPDCACSSHFVNYAFDHAGYHFIALDLVTRTHGPFGDRGVTSEADLFDFEGGTWRWFTSHLDAYEGLGDHNVFIFSHHPPVVTTLGLFDCLSTSERDRIAAYIRDGGYGDAIFGFFAGHHHLDYDLTRYEGQHVIVTPAEKDGGTVRLIRVLADGTVHYGTFL